MHVCRHDTIHYSKPSCIPLNMRTCPLLYLYLFCRRCHVEPTLPLSPSSTRPSGAFWPRSTKQTRWTTRSFCSRAITGTLSVTTSIGACSSVCSAVCVLCSASDNGLALRSRAFGRFCYLQQPVYALWSFPRRRKGYPYEATAHVPLIIRWHDAFSPVFPRGSILSGAVTELRDVLPTLLDVAGEYNSHENYILPMLRVRCYMLCRSFYLADLHAYVYSLPLDVPHTRAHTHTHTLYRMHVPLAGVYAPTLPLDGAPLTCLLSTPSSKWASSCGSNGTGWRPYLDLEHSTVCV